MNSKHNRSKYSSSIKKSILISCSVLAITSTLTMTNVKAETIVPKKSIAIAQDISWMNSNATVVGSSISINIAQHFNILDSKSLVITAVSSDNSIITPSVNNNILNLEVKAIGVAVITVTASDNTSTLIDKFEVRSKKLGDINGDGYINPTDAFRINSVVSGTLKVTDEEKQLMDLNDDGQVTKADSDIIMNTYVGKPNTGIVANAAINIKNVNDAPAAINVNLSGTSKVGETLSGNYSFTDVDGDGEGSTSFKWYRATKADGSDKVQIDGASSKQYTLKSEDGDKYIFFEVTPAAATGQTTGTAVLSQASSKVIVPDTTAPSLVIGKFNFVNNLSPQEDTISGLAGAVSEGGAVVKAYPWVDANKDNKVDISELQTPITLGTSAQDGSVAAKNIGDLAPGKYSYIITATDSEGNESLKTEASALNIAIRDLNAVPANRTELLENNLDSAVIRLQVKGDTFKQGLAAGDFVLNNAPAGTTLGGVSVVSEDTVELTLRFDGTDFDISISSFSVNAKASALQSGKDITSQSLTIKNSNDAPAANNVSITGTARVGETLTGTYQYKDDEMDSEGSSTFKWYRGTKADGSDKVLIDGASSNQYTLTLADGDKYIFFEVTPVAASGKTTGNAVISTASSKIVIPDTTAPTLDISKFSVTGTNITGAAGAVSEEGAAVKAYPWVDANHDNVVDNGELGTAITVGTSVQDGSVVANSVGSLNPGRYKYVITVTDAAGNESPKNAASVLNIAVRGLTAGFVNRSELKEESLNSAVISVEIKGDSFNQAATLGDFELNNAPTGVSIAGVSYIDEAKVEITLNYDGTDFDNTISNFSIKAKASALQSGQAIDSQNLTISNSNDAPMANNVNITGTASVGETLTGNYQFRDDEMDSEGSSIFKWYRGNNADGSDKVQINGAASNQYTLTLADGDKYIFFEVTPVAASGKTTGNTIISTASSKIVIPDTTAPTLDMSKFSVTGTNITGAAGAVSEEGAAVKAYPWVDANHDNVVDNGELGTAVTVGTSTQDGSVAANSVGSLNPGKYKYIITVTDAAGNESPKDAASAVDVVLRGLTSSFVNRTELTEDNLNSAVISVEIKGDSFNQGAALGDFELNNAPSGVSIGGVSYIDEAKVELTLNYDGTDFDNTISNFSVKAKAVALQSGQAIDSQNITISNSNDAPVANNVNITGTARVGETLTGNYQFSDDESDSEGTTVLKWYRGNNSDGSDKVEISGANANKYTLTADDGDKYILFQVTPVASTGKATGKAVVSQASSKVVIPDTTAPTLDISKFSVTGTTVNGIAGAVSEQGASVKAYPWIDANQDNVVDNGELGTAITVGTSTQDGSVAANSVGSLNPGRYKYVITATDNAGNESPKTEAAVVNVWIKTLTVSLFDRTELAEDNLDTATLEVKLDGDSFNNGISEGDFQLNNAPAGVSIGMAYPLDEKTVYLVLQFDGQDFDTDISNFSVTAKQSATASGEAMTTNDLPIKAVIESLAPDVSGITWTTGTATGTTAASAVPGGTLKYMVGTAGQFTRPYVGELATSYTNSLMASTDIPVTSGQHIFVVTVNSNNRITAWSDISVADANIKKRPQVKSAFISDLVNGGDGRVFFQVYSSYSNGAMESGYSIDVYKWNSTTRTKQVYTISMLPFYQGMPYVVINSYFYDFFDLTPAYYYNEEADLTSVNALVLKKNGVVIDVLGDPNYNGSKPIIGTDKSMTRKAYIYSGYNIYDSNEWTVTDGDMWQYADKHTVTP